LKSAKSVISHLDYFLPLRLYPIRFAKRVGARACEAAK